MTQPRVRYDPQADAAYISLTDAPEHERVTTTVPVAPPDESVSVLIDFNAQNRLVGVEVLGARRVLAPELLADAARPQP